MSSGKQILIIGGSSFVARNFIRLHQDKYAIKVVSRSTTGFVNELIKKDFSELKVLDFEGVDVVINCAAIVHQIIKVADNVYDEINNKLAVDIAVKAKEAGVEKFIQLSTIAVYGNQNHITPETKESPLTPYGKSKLAADNALIEMGDNQFDVVVFRPPMIYGKKDAPGNMMKLIKLVEKGIPLPFKNVTNQRDFIHIDNLIGFIDASISSNCKGIFLVSDNHPISTSELCKIIAEALQQKSKLFSVTKLGLGLLKTVKPGLYFKLISDSTIDIKTTIIALKYKPENMLNQGILEMIKGMYNQK